MHNPNKILVGGISIVTILLLLISIITLISISSKSASGQQGEEDESLSFIKHLNSSSYSEVAEDVGAVHENAFAIREIGDAMMSNSSLCSIIDNVDRCDLVALSLTNYLVSYDFEDEISKTEAAKNRLGDFQQNLTFEALNDFAHANSDVAKSLYELLIKGDISLDGTGNLDGSNSAEPLSSTSELSTILMEAGQMANNAAWISSGKRLMTLMSNIEQKYSDINTITGIINSVEASSLPRNESGFYAIGFGVAGALIVSGILIQLLLRGKKRNQYGL